MASLTACSDDPVVATAESAATCGSYLAPDPLALENDLLAAMFPRSASNEPILCDLDGQSPACVPGHTNLDGVSPWSGSPPSMASCAGASGPQLQACDHYARHVLTKALDDGDLAGFVFGVARLEQIMMLPQVPSYYHVASPQNVFVQWLQSANVAIAEVGACALGTPDDVYLCLATNPSGPSSTTVRGLLELLDRHNGVLARSGQLAGATARQTNIVRSASAPAFAYAAATGNFVPGVGPGIQNIHALSRVFGLRLLDGAAAAGPETELEFLQSLSSYVPAGAPAQPYHKLTAAVMLAQMSAKRWRAEAEVPLESSAEISRDLRELSLSMQLIAQASAALGACSTSEEQTGAAHWIAQRTAISSHVPNYLVPVSSFGAPTITNATVHEIPDAIFLELFLRSNLSLVRECGMHVELVSLSHTYTRYEVATEEEDCVVGDSFGTNGPIVDCECTDFDYFEAGDQPDADDIYEACLAWTVTYRASVTDLYTAEWQVVNDQLLATREVVQVFAVAMTYASVIDGYKRLLDSDDDGNGTLEADEIYSHPDSGEIDLNFEDDIDPTIVRAGVNWQVCRDEFHGTAYDYTGPPTGSTDPDCNGVADPRVNSNCGDPALTGMRPGGGQEFFIPYPIALRICPRYTATIAGVLDEDFSASLANCATPWSYTQAVHHFLEHETFIDPVSDPSEIEERHEALKGLAIDFAAEALHLTQPVAAMYRKEADLASVVGSLVASSDDWYEDNAGLDRVHDRLRIGYDVMKKGLDLVVDFEALDIWDEPGAEVIATQWKDAWEVCLVGCQENYRDNLRTGFYRRLRDAVETFSQLSTDLFKTQWRRLDGNRCYDDDPNGAPNDCRSCVVPHDGDGDGVDDRWDCKHDGDLDGNGDGQGAPNVRGCDVSCPVYDQAFEVVEDGGLTLARTNDLLDRHASLGSTTDIAEFLQNVADYAETVRRRLFTDEVAMLSGVDWLGYKDGAVYPGIDLGNFSEASEKVTSILGNGAVAGSIGGDLAQANISTFVVDYLGHHRQLSQFANQVDDGISQWQEAQTYCGLATGSCVTEWRDDYPEVAEINELLRDKICDRGIALHYWNGTEAVRQEPLSILDENEGCPVFASPDFAATEGVTGSIPAQVLQLRAILEELKVWIHETDSRIIELERQDLERVELIQAQADYNQKLEERAALIEGVRCAINIIKVVLVAVPIIPEATAALSKDFAKSTSNAGSSCMALVGALNARYGDKPSAADLELAFRAYSMSASATAERLAMEAQFNNLIRTSARYREATQRYWTLAAELARANAYRHQQFQHLYGSPIFDPSVQRYTDITLDAMKLTFEGLARKAREAAFLLSYDTGNPVLEGSFFPLNASVKYYLPPLAEITAISAPGIVYGDSAAGLLNDAFDVLNPGEANEHRWNLVSYASVLRAVHMAFIAVGGDRVQTTQPVDIGRDVPGMPGLATTSTNAGEAAMLGDSAFYDPFTNADNPADLTLGVTCARGEVDLHDYCTFYTDATTGALTTTTVQDGTCVDVTSMTATRRYDLAYADHLLRGIGVDTFECIESVEECVNYDYKNSECLDEEPTIVPADIRPAEALDSNPNDTVLTFDEDLLDNNTAAPEYYNAAYYAAQTRVVRRILDRLAIEVDSNGLGASQVHLEPGRFLFHIDMSDANPLVGTTPMFDPEHDLFEASSGGAKSPDSMSEQLVSLVFVCVDDHACGPDPKEAQVLIMGPGYLGNRCSLEVDRSRQERIRFEFDPVLISNVTAFENTSNPVDRAAIVNSYLNDPAEIDKFSALPIHTNGWLVSLEAHADNKTWPLYDGGSTPIPRLVPSLKYSYYNTGQLGSAFAYKGRSLMQCQLPDGYSCEMTSCAPIL
ncbi:MAG: hypothetical protein RIT81_13390 [Deltaproteobacteria bacterium]